MGALCSCFRGVRDDVASVVTPSSSSSIHSNANITIDHHQHHANPRVLQFFQRGQDICPCAQIVFTEALTDHPPIKFLYQLFGSKYNSVRPEASQTRSIEIADQGTWDSSGYHSDSSEECPTCLEYYTDENPKIETECSHHFHLPCILEWYQRSEECPNCRQVLIVKGVIGEWSDPI